MNIQLGNLELRDIVEEEYLEKIQTFFDNNGYKREMVCNDISNQKGNYHIFDIPRLIVICGEDKMQEFVSFLKDNALVANAFKGQIGLTYELEK